MDTVMDGDVMPTKRKGAARWLFGLGILLVILALSLIHI